MPKVIILKGLPGSGKDYFAKKYISEHPNTKRVNKDLLREMLDFSKWSNKNEKFVLQVRDAIIKLAIENGYDIIVSDTNLSPKHEKRIRSILPKEVEIEINDSFLNVPVEVCIERDRHRDKSVGLEVILNMYNQFIAKNQKPESFFSFKEENKLSLHELKYDPIKEDAIIVDMDGTLALRENRSPFEYDKCENDRPNRQVVNIVKLLASMYKIIIISGREDFSKEKTINWLKKNHIYFDKLYMRKTGDYRKDYIIKKEIYDTYIKDNYNVIMVIDDRPQVIRLWKELQLPVFDVGLGIDF